MYSFDGALSRLASVLGVWSGKEHNFVWNPEGTLARWVGPVPTPEGQSIIYERFFEYNEAGWLARFWRREEESERRLLQEFRYNSDGCLVQIINYWEGKEYRFGCSMSCGAGIRRTYSRPLSGLGGDWVAQEDYVHTPTSWWFSDPFASSELRSPNAVWVQDLREDGTVYAGYVKDVFEEPVGYPSPIGFPYRPMPPFYHPVPPPLDLPRPYLPGNILELILCRLKAAVVVAVIVFPPIAHPEPPLSSPLPPGSGFSPPPPHPPQNPLSPSKLPSPPSLPGIDLPSIWGDVVPHIWHIVPEGGISYGLCTYICKTELRLPYCKALCGVLMDGGCDGLFHTCLRSRSDLFADACMSLYVTICSGR